MKYMLSGCGLLLMLSGAVFAGDEVLTVDRLHDGRSFRTRSFGPFRWLESGGLTRLVRAGEGRDLVREDPRTGEREVLVASSRLVPAGESAPLRVADYQWSDDGRQLLVFTNTRRVWRTNSRGDYWVLDLDTDRLRRIGAGFPEASLQFAKFSPDGGRVAFVQANDIWIESIETGDLTRLTEGGSDTLIHGTFDWVYEEEFAIRDGFRWSNDGRSIAFWRIDSSPVKAFTLVDYTSDVYPTLKPIQYPKVGTENSRVSIGVAPAEGGDVTWMDIPIDEAGHYVARMEWAPHGDDLILQWLSRRQDELRVLRANPRSGATETLFVDRDDTWVEVVDDLTWIEDGRAFLWPSERDGWRHLWRVDADTGEARLVTPGRYDVIELLRVDEARGDLWVLASPTDPTRRFLYRTPITGGEPTRATPAELGGTNTYDISLDARFAVHTHSAFGVPPHVELISLPNHGTVRDLIDNDRATDELSALARGRHDFFRVRLTDELELDAWMMKPPDFDPDRSWPLLVHVYGEPAGQTVLDRWGGGNYLWHVLMTQLGYVVVSIDNRGTPGPRGRDFRKSIHKQIGIIAAEDQATALRSILDRHDWLDRERVGIWGWSGGGSMSLNAIFRHPDLYRAAVAVAFIANQRYYDTIYQERYMGLPHENEEGFREGSPITHAHRLRGDLLLVYGTGDDNCHYQNMEALVNELVAHDRPFKMLSYPNRTHGISEGKNTRRHLYKAITRHFMESIPPER